MSGTVPPPPPMPGGGPDPRDVPELDESGTVADVPRRPAAQPLPPSISPSTAGPLGARTAPHRSEEAPGQRASAPWATEHLPPVPPAPTVHAPIPPAPTQSAGSQSGGSAGSRAEGSRAAWGPPREPDPWATQSRPPAQPAADQPTSVLPAAVQPSSGQPTSVQPPVQPPVPPRRAAFQPGGQQLPAEQQYPPRHDDQPTAPQPPVQQPAQNADQGDWWGGQWSAQRQQPPTQPPAATYPPAPAYQPGASYPSAPQAYAPSGQSYGQAPAYGEAQGYDQGYEQGYGQGYPQARGGDYGTPPPAYGGTPAPPPPPGGGKRRRRLTPGWIAFIAVDALLIVAAVIFAVQIFGAPPVRNADTAEGPGTQATAQATEPAPEKTEKPKPLAQFASPSRNITCSIFDDAVTCGIAELDQQPAPVENCSGTTGYVVTIAGADGKVAVPCVEARDKPKTAGKKMDVLDYGESVTQGDFTCTSAESGMQCRHDPSGSGFSLARAGIGTL